MSNRNFNKQTTNARQALAQGGEVGKKRKPQPSPKPKAGRPSFPKKGAGPAGRSKKTNKVDLDKLKSLEPIIIDLDLSRPTNDRKIKIKKVSK